METMQVYRVGGDPRSIYFPCYRDGQLIMVKWRSLSEKKFGVLEKNMEPCLFGWQAIPPDARNVAICEGEIDALSLHEYKIPALSVPFGGGGGEKQKWIETEFDYLERFDEIFLVMDPDTAGQQAVDEIVDRLGRHRCRVVKLPYKDPNDCLRAGVLREHMEKCFADARTLDPTELRPSLDYLEDVLQSFRPESDINSGVSPWDKCGDLQLRRGEVIAIGGVNGHGKSEAVGQLTLEAMVQGKRACVASLEFLPHLWLHRLVLQASGVAAPTDQYIRAIMQYFDDRLWVFDLATTVKHRLLLDVFLYARQRYGVDFFVIDNLTKLDVGLEDYDGQKALMDLLTDFAKHHQVTVILVVHLRKPSDDKKPGNRFDIKGSGAIGDLSDTVIIWWRNKPKEEKLRNKELLDHEIAEIQKIPDTICIVDKQRNTGKEPLVALWFHEGCHQFLQFPKQRPRQFISFRGPPS